MMLCGDSGKNSPNQFAAVLRLPDDSFNDYFTTDLMDYIVYCYL